MDSGIHPRPQPLTDRSWPGWFALALIASVLALVATGLASHTRAGASAEVLGDPYIWRVLGFTFWQAALSTVLSVALAVPVARALHRRRDHRATRWLTGLSSLAFVTPSIVAITGIAAVHGRNGWVNGALNFVGLDGGGYLYGLPGILIAHVFFNLPLAARLYYQAIVAIPAENWRLAAQLGFRSRDNFRLMEWPVMRAVLPGVAGIIFLLCFASFAVVLTLGGGPRATTLEVAIYQALRLDFDIGQAVVLSILQLLCCASVYLAVTRVTRFPEETLSTGIGVPRPDRDEPVARRTDRVALAVLIAWIVLPLAAVVVSALTGFRWSWLRDRALTEALSGSLTVALPAALIAVVLALALAFFIKDLRLHRQASQRANALEAAGGLILVVPPLVLGTGLFLALRPIANISAVGPAIVVMVNALLAMPFALRVLAPAVLRHARQSDRLCASLGIAGRARFKAITWPALGPRIGFALALSAALSAGDLSVIALFGTQDFNTLPMLIYRLMSAYRLADAAVTSVVLVMLSLALFWFFERVVGRAGIR